MSSSHPQLPNEASSNISFPKEEERINSYWERIDAFQTSLKKSEGRPEYTFYDGPPFATGLPHYGHILAGTIKDIVTRYAHQTGHHVERRFGWDCHGLPIEFEIEKQLGIKTREEVLKLGIDNYNAECRKIVMRFSSEWRRVVSRMGRWIDFDNDYKTMNAPFMESVWWVFKQLFEKGLVYRGYKVMPYSTACTTPLSNFEATLNYKEVSDPAVMIAFPLEEEPETSMVAWTTTPWTLPSNLALCVHPEFDYVKVADQTLQGRQLIVAEALLPKIYKKATDYKVISKCKGAELKGKKYTPLFPYFGHKAAQGAFQILTDTYVTADAGTGIVHQAPAFGEDDYRVCSAAGIIAKGEDVPCPVDANGRFTAEVTDFAGKYIKDADKEIVQHIKRAGRLINAGTLVHSYPFCWRSETPLIYRAVPSWFIRVEDIKEKLLKNNKATYWVPEFVQEKRFHNWLQDARDWAVSRNRYWGTPLPIWASADFKEVVCIGSVDELEALSGVRVTDLHRENIDHITIPSKSGNGVLRRIEEVFDCWFESGSMPYAQQHYPFENKDRFESTFPADFIAEGIDQTRGWFYTLMVLSTALFDKPPFKNLIVNGLVLAADGKKMSKRLSNYPDPSHVINSYGADSLRLYLINSPVVRAENLKFKEEGVREVVRDVILPWYNAYCFFIQYSRRFILKTGKTVTGASVDATKSTNIMDRWIMAASHSLIKFVKQEMDAYRLYTVVPKLLKFIDNLTNWYVRFNRLRLKGSTGEEDCQMALATLFSVLYTVARTMAPFTPFITETMYQNLKLLLPEAEREDSLHYVMMPEFRADLLNPRIEEAVARMQTVIELGRVVRDRKKISLKMPLRSCTIVHKDSTYIGDLEQLKSYIAEELNVRDVILSSEESNYVFLKAEADQRALGPKVGKARSAVDAALKALTHDQISAFLAAGEIEIQGFKIVPSDVKITRESKVSQDLYESHTDGEVLILLDLRVDESLQAQGLAREFINRVQKLRKKAGLTVEDEVEVFFTASVDAAALDKMLASEGASIASTLRCKPAPLSSKPSSAILLDEEEVEVGSSKLVIQVCRAALAFADSLPSEARLFLSSKSYSRVMSVAAANNGVYSFVVNGNKYELKLCKDFFAGQGEKLSA